MCPDPFDYSGPVPNGSSPQNDFRARSNGTRQLGTAPHPWPPVVQDEHPSSPAADDVETSSVLVTAGTRGASDENSVVPAVNTAVDRSTQETDPEMVPTTAGPAEASPPATEPAAEPEAEAAPGEAASAAVPTPPAASRGAEHPPAAAVPADAETPGWRRRGPRRFE